jgi:hypothetical protein
MKHPTCMRCEMNPDAPCKGYPYCHGYLSGCQCARCEERYNTELRALRNPARKAKPGLPPRPRNPAHHEKEYQS